MLTVIMAGGKGTRISSVASDIPKPMIDLCGKPILERQIECLKRQGINEVVLIVGHLKNKIIDHFGDGNSFGIKISYVEEDTPLGTAGGLYYIKGFYEDRCRKEPILLINGDLVFDISIERFLKYHMDKNSDITLFTHPNNHPYDSALIIANQEGQVIQWLNKEDSRGDYKNKVNAGLHLIAPQILEDMWNLSGPAKLDLDRDIIKAGLMNKSLKAYAYDSPEYVKDMGTPERYMQVCEDFKNGLVESKNLLKKQKAIFLDRDGTINQHPGGIYFITKPEELKLIDGAAQAISIINNSEYLAIVATNQPIVARGDCTLEELEAIHNRMERLLGDQGAYLDDIIFCPHHPDKGYAGERPKYKIHCECRKPKPGMLLNMADKYNIDLSESFMIGDSKNDLLAGRAAGCKTCYINRDESEIDSNLYDYQTSNLYHAVKWIFAGRE